MSEETAQDLSSELQTSIQQSEENVDKLLESLTKEDGILQCGNKSIDLVKAFPLTLGDFRRLEDEGLIDPQSNIKVDGPNAIAKLILLLVRKVDSTVTEEELDSLDLEKVGRVFLFVRKKMMEKDADLNPTQ